MDDGGNIIDFPKPESQQDDESQYYPCTFIAEGKAYNTYFLSFEINGEKRGLHLLALSYEEAVDSIKAIGATGHIDGQIVVSIPKNTNPQPTE